MIEIRFHGRGGQGVVTGAELIAISAFYDGKFSQAFPYFGVERRGAPIEAYARIDEKFITLRQQIKEPDILIIQDASLLHNDMNILNGLKNHGLIFINTSQDLNVIFTQLGKIENKNGKFVLSASSSPKKKIEIIPIDGASIALKILGKPIVNTLMAFTFARKTNLISLNAVRKALSDKFSGILLEKNLLLEKEC